MVAITVIPVLVYLFIDVQHVPKEQETWMQRGYVPILRWALSTRGRRWLVLGLALLSFMFSGALLASRPFAFLPSFGDPQIAVSVELPSGTSLLETNQLVDELESFVNATVPEDELTTLQVIVGSSGFSDFAALFGGGGGVTESQANVTIALRSQELLEEFTPIVREEAVRIFGEENVTVSAGGLGSGDFNSIELVLSGVSQDALAEIDTDVVNAIESIDGIANVESNLSAAGAGDGSSTTYIRVNGQPAVSYQGDLETEDTLSVTQDAIEAVKALPNLPQGVVVSQGFTSEIQSNSFADIGLAMVIAITIVVIILIVTFNSIVYWLALILSIVVAPVGAAVALTITDRALSISAMIGLLMLFGLVVTNAVVLLDRVGSNRKERGMSLYEALIEAGGRRVRPILMTALATVIALLPLAVGLSEGAIIAAELGTVVIGGVVSSTLLTLLVVPVAYYLLSPVHNALARLVGRGEMPDEQYDDETKKQ